MESVKSCECGMGRRSWGGAAVGVRSEEKRIKGRNGEEGEQGRGVVEGGAD